MAAPRQHADESLPRDDGWLPRATRPLLLVLGTVGVVAALASVMNGDGGTTFWLLIAYVCAMLFYVVAHLATILAAPRRLLQAAYVALLPAAATVCLAAFFILWGQMDIAVTLGLLGGVVVQAAFNPAVVGSAVADTASDHTDADHPGRRHATDPPARSGHTHSPSWGAENVRRK